MALSSAQKKFIEQIASAVNKYKSNYGIMVASPIIAQAIIESRWGKSTLASKYHNYFGLKCGSSWKGKSVNMQTAEEYVPGVHTNIRDNFRVYDDLDAGVKGYFDFISYSRYANLKGVTDPETYVKNIKADGYATSSTYVSTLMNCIKNYNLTQYDNVGSAAASNEENKPTQSGKKTVAAVAHEVLLGKWGNGVERKNRLTAAGYNYSEVQHKVNEIVNGK